MTTPLLGPTIVTLMTDVTRKGGTPIDRIFRWVAGSLKWKETCAGANDRGFATITIPSDDRVIASLAEFLVLRIDQPQPLGSAVPFRTYEFRITQLNDKAADPNVVITCAPIINDFGRVQLRTVNGGVPSKVTTFTGTPAEFFDALILPQLAAQGETGIVAGTILDGPALNFSARNASVLGILSFLEQKYTTDAFLTRIDDATSALNLTTRGSAELSPRAILGRNVVELDRTIVVDDSVFANRVDPEGTTATGEAEPTTIGQAAWEATARSGTGGRAITLADPLGGDGPVTVDDELNGKRAMVTLDPIHFAYAEFPVGSAATAIKAIALDTSRSILWGYTANGADRIWWKDLVDDANSGTLSLGAGATSIERMVYDAVNDRIVCACGDVAKVVIVNASTKAVAGTVTTSGVPGHLCGVGNGHVFIGYIATADFDVIDCSGSGSVQGTLTGTSTYDGRTATVMYHAGSARYFAFNDTGGFHYYTASSLASAGTGTGLGTSAVVATDPSQTAIAVLSIVSAKFSTVNPSSGAVTSQTTPALPFSPVSALGAAIALFSRFSRVTLLATSGILAYDPTANAWLPPMADAGRHDVPTSPWLVGYDVELGPTADEDAILYVADLGAVRRFRLTKFVAFADGGDGDYATPFSTWAIQDSAAAASTITAPASGSGGPVTVAVDADAATPGQGALIEVRENAQLEYRTQLSDVDSITAVGAAVDASPQFDVLAKRNYWRGSTFNPDVWRSDRTNRWLTAIWEGPTYFGDMEQRWSQADQTGFAFLPITLTATWHNSTTTPDLTMSVSGLNNGTVLSPGDVITLTPSFAGTAGHFFYVRQRTVADSSGNATVPITPPADFSLADQASGTTVYLTSPSLAIANNRSDCLALYPTRGVSAVTAIVRWPKYTALVPVPRLVGDQRAWVVAHVKLAAYAAIPADLKLSVEPPFEAAFAPAPTTITPGDTVQLVSGELRDYWLSVPLDLINFPTHGFLRATLTCGPSTTMTFGLNAVVYVQSLQVILAANSSEPVDVYGAEGPVALYQLAAARLAEISQPTKNYQLKVIEDDPARPWIVGAIATLRDPQRSIYAQDQSSRVISVTEYGILPDSPLRLPDVEIGHSPLNNFVAGIVTTGAAVTTPKPSLLPGTPVAGGGGGVGTTGGLTDMPVLFAEGTGGAFHANNQYKWTTGLTYAIGAGRNGGNAWKTRNFSSQGVSFPTDVTDQGRNLLWIDLDSLTLDADGQCLLQLLNLNVSGALHLVFGLDVNRHVVAYRSDSTGEVQIAISSSQVPATGKYLLEFGWKIDPSTGYVTCRGYDISAGTTSTFTLFFDQRSVNTLSDNAGGTPESIGVVMWGADAFTSTAFTVGGIDDIILGIAPMFDATGFTADHYIGDVMSGTAFGGSDGHYVDVPGLHYSALNDEDADGQISCGIFDTAGQTQSVVPATWNNVSSVLAMIPMATYIGLTANSSLKMRVGIRSGTTDADNGGDMSVGSAHWDSAMNDPAGGGYTLGQVFNQDPATSAAWGLTAAQNAEPFFKCAALGSDGLGLQLTQLGMTVVYRPTASTDGMTGGVAGARAIPVSPVFWTGFDQTNTLGRAIYNRLQGGGGVLGNRAPGDYYSNTAGGSDSSRAGKLDSTFGGATFGFSGNVTFDIVPLAGGATSGVLVMPTSFALPLEWDAIACAALWFDFNGASLSAELPVFRFIDQGGTEQIRVGFDTSRHAIAKRMDTSPTTLQTSSATYDASGINGFSVEVALHPTLGFVKVWRIDSTGARTLIINYSGSTIRNGGTPSHSAIDRIKVFGVYSGTNADTMRFDDPVAASSGTTGGGTGLQGLRSCTLRPNGAGTYNDSTAHDYTKVQNDDDTAGQYNVFTAANKKDSYLVDGVPVDCVNIVAAQVNAFASLDSGGTGSDKARPLAIVGGQLVYGPRMTIDHAYPDGNSAGASGISASLYPLVIRTDPSDGSALAAGDFGGSNAEGGLEVLTHNNDVRLRQIAVEILYEWTP